MIERQLKDKILEMSKQYPALLLTGPRQSGKTTLAKMVFPEKLYVSFENPTTRRQFEDDPNGFIKRISKGAILDEVQNVPKLLSYLQGEIDNDRTNGRYVLTESNNFKLMDSIVQTLAGRVAIFTLLPLSISEAAGHNENITCEQMILKGRYPQVIAQGADYAFYYSNYYQTYVERDVRLLKNVKDLWQFSKFTSLCAGRIGSILDETSLSNDAGISVKTVGEWLNILEASYICFRLYPWCRSRTKRLVKKPKLYFYDTGLACSILGINSEEALACDRLKGPLFENLVISEKIKNSMNTLSNSKFHYYRTSDGHEVDLIVENNRKLTAIDIKAGATFTSDYAKGLALFQSEYAEDVRELEVIYTGDEEFEFKGTKVANYLKELENKGNLTG